MIPTDPSRRPKLRGPAAGGTTVLFIADGVLSAPRGTCVDDHCAGPRQPSAPETLFAVANDHSGGYFPHTLEPAA